MLPGRVGLIVTDNPPVNALSAAVRHGLQNALEAALADDGIDAIVIACQGRTFFAGADITEFGKPVADPSFHALFAALEASSKPIVAAIHGTALGGGLELALACHYRVAAESGRVGLPEVNLGILPGAGGTQRVPRLVGAERALELLTSGRQVAMPEAVEIGLVDALSDDLSLREVAARIARKAVGKPLPRVRDLTDFTLRDRQKPGLFEAFLSTNARRFRGLPAPPAIVRAIEAAVNLPFEQGMAVEKQLCDELIASPESEALRYLFFAEREAGRVPDVPVGTAVRDIARVAVIGAGTMGSGIALALLAAGLVVILIDTDAEAVERGVKHVASSLEAQVKRGRLEQTAAETQLANLVSGIDIASASDADLIIEAVYENMDLKKKIFVELDRVAKSGAIIASNTSFLDIDEMASVTSRPDDVLGLHFFSPANIMRLLEIVRGARTSPETMATAFAFARRIGKVGVLSRVCNGFIANRLMLPRAVEAEALALEGVPISVIDRVLVDYGFAIGHFQMMDMAGIDVITRGQTERTLMGDLVNAGRLGLKTGAGFYDYDDKRHPVASREVEALIAAYARDNGIPAKPIPDDAVILSRLLAPVVAEGRKILDEGIAVRESDVDLAAVLGFNWPSYRGGPLFWAASSHR